MGVRGRGFHTPSGGGGLNQSTGLIFALDSAIVKSKLS